MKEELDLLGYVHFDNTRWLNELHHVNREIDIYQNRLLEFMHGFEDESVIDELSDLYDSFEVMKMTIDKIQKKIRENQFKNKTMTQSNGSLKEIVTTLHSQAEQYMNDFQIAYKELKNKFHQFTKLQKK